MEKISVKLCMALSRIQALDSWSDNAANCNTAMEKIQCRMEIIIGLSSFCYHLMVHDMMTNRSRSVREHLRGLPILAPSHGLSARVALPPFHYLETWSFERYRAHTDALGSR